jgi:hypothetical protein
MQRKVKMGNNAEIRKRMETYRSILLVLNWIFAIAFIIFGFVLAITRYTQGIGIGIIIGSVILGIIGHFLTNVALAIPFILLNNGDILESQMGKSGGVFIPTHKVKLLTNAEGMSLRKEPNAYTDAYMKIPNETEVQYLSTGGEAELGERKGSWFEIKTKDGKRGWCFSGSLEKI